jgi:hypothetical protein|tara:strand:+ start:32042 stop:32266 length:225 start_codon:yes stop_codon:yes gene_type:complete
MGTEAHRGINLYFASADGAALSTEQDALDLLGKFNDRSGRHRCTCEVLSAGLFDLSSREAGPSSRKCRTARRAE